MKNFYWLSFLAALGTAVLVLAVFSLLIPAWQFIPETRMIALRLKKNFAPAVKHRVLPRLSARLGSAQKFAGVSRLNAEPASLKINPPENLWKQNRKNSLQALPKVITGNPDQNRKSLDAYNPGAGPEEGKRENTSADGGSGGQNPPGRESPVSQSPNQEENPLRPADRTRLLADFQALVGSRLNQVRQYPPDAREQGASGFVLLGFLIRPDGSIAEVRALESSGNSALDRSALAAAYAGAPYRPFPPGFPTGIKIKARVVFKLNP